MCIGNGSSTLSDNRSIELTPDNDVADRNGNFFQKNKIVTSKYTIWNFVPKNLYEQLRRIGNIYFVVTAILAVTIESPVSPVTSWLPLLFVILTTAIKQGYEDLLRHQSDRQVNNRSASVIRRKCVQEIHCQQIVVGDIVKVKRDEDVPCDIIIMYSSDLSGKCYVTTSNLDGETNLKTLMVPKIFLGMDTADIVSLRATITCQPPIAALYTFEGKVQIEWPDGTFQSGPLSIENLALRGARLKDTDYIIGCAAYTGSDTKLSLNSKISVVKFSTVEKTMNKYIMVFIGVLLIEIVSCTIIKYCYEYFKKWQFYLGEVTLNYFTTLFEDMISFLILLNYIIPISLYVTIEIQRFLGSYFFHWDVGMYDAENDKAAILNTSDVNEDLGQVEYLFSDKTGTLTENLMIFRRCFIDGNSYMEKDCDGHLYLLQPDGNEQNAQRIDDWNAEIWHFMLSICLCHDVHIAPLPQKMKAEMERVKFRESVRLHRTSSMNSSLMMDPGLPEYEAASVDEKALVEAAARFGVVFRGAGDSDDIIIDAQGTILLYQRLDTLEFSSRRKRMSVIIEDTDGDIWLYCKGADSSVLPLILDEDIESAKISLTDFSMRGLRTLVFGFKKFTKEEYKKIDNEINEIRQTMGPERQLCIERTYDMIENGLKLLGVTAVEDRLQEDVSETMEKLSLAGIKIWVLTGDKVETAENIAYFCGHFKRSTIVLRFVNLRTPQIVFFALTNLERKMNMSPFSQYGFLADGTSLSVAIDSCPGLLRRVTMSCEAVVCCRMSPLQKSQVVQLIKNAHGKPLTAAIGDGGNDVSMIKEAHVGLGIMGKEGRQAAMSADFAFSKFKHLQRALLVHGHWYYLRVATLTQYFFYKNVVFVLPQLFFNFQNDFSEQALYNSMYLMGFNLIYSSVPILIFGIFEKDHSDKVLLKFSQLYQLHAKNYLLSLKQFIFWMLTALWQGSFLYYIPYFYWKMNPINMYDSTMADIWCYSTCISHLVTLVINLQLLIVSSHWTIPFISSIFLTEALFFVTTFLYCIWSWHFDGDMYQVFPRLLKSPTFWIVTVLVVIICLAPALLFAFHKAGRPARLKGKLDRREEAIKSIMSVPLGPTSPVLNNRRYSSIIPWRRNVTLNENVAI
ncbi:hypothetical protein QAD02_019353 [Eretmocerus hayati]|uniref:Uncharacterized protein n=1 Tax=Eretmocerus hayati TaxID=131215 RepID=A0ACC2PL67_9HYME|nr:hypothetical protein QAD02_019353 [Eretmocerus hayati]